MSSSAGLRLAVWHLLPGRNGRRALGLLMHVFLFLSETVKSSYSALGVRMPRPPRAPGNQVFGALSGARRDPRVVQERPVLVSSSLLQGPCHTRCLEGSARISVP